MGEAGKIGWWAAEVGNEAWVGNVDGGGGEYGLMKKSGWMGYKTRSDGQKGNKGNVGYVKGLRKRKRNKW